MIKDFDFMMILILTLTFGYDFKILQINLCYPDQTCTRTLHSLNLTESLAVLATVVG